MYAYTRARAEVKRRTSLSNLTLVISRVRYRVIYLARSRSSGKSFSPKRAVWLPSGRQAGPFACTSDTYDIIKTRNKELGSVLRDRAFCVYTSETTFRFYVQVNDRFIAILADLRNVQSIVAGKVRI